MPTEHQKRIALFMTGAKQEVADRGYYHQNNPPSFEIRRLRAKLILEEAFETIRDLGVELIVSEYPTSDAFLLEMSLVEFYDNSTAWDYIGVIDGCADISVVTIGTLAALGVDDEPVLETVDLANLSKLAEGHSFREDGKLIKSPTFVNPDYKAALVIAQDIKHSIKNYKVR